MKSRPKVSGSSQLVGLCGEVRFVHKRCARLRPQSEVMVAVVLSMESELPFSVCRQTHATAAAVPEQADEGGRAVAWPGSQLSVRVTVMS